VLKISGDPLSSGLLRAATQKSVSSVIRYFPGEDISAVPVHFRYKIDKSFQKPDISYIIGPNLIRSDDFYIPEQIRIDEMTLPRLT